MEGKVNSKKINLIPTEMAVPARAVKIAALLNKISIVAVILLIISILGVGGSVYYFNNQNNSINRRIASLKSEIARLEVNEQKLVLAKDRLSKISKVQESKSVNDEISRFKKFSDIVAVNPEIVIAEANLSTKGTEVSISTPTSTALGLILAPLSNLDVYKKIIMSSLSYNVNTGFLSTISLENE